MKPNDIVKKYAKTIPDRCPETKQGEAVYTLVKGLKLFVRNCEEINFQFMRRIICSEQGSFSQEY